MPFTDYVRVSRVLLGAVILSWSVPFLTHKEGRRKEEGKLDVTNRARGSCDSSLVGDAGLNRGVELIRNVIPSVPRRA